MTLSAAETEKFIEAIRTGSYSFDEDTIDDYSDDFLVAFAERDISFINKLPKSRMSDPVLFAVAENEKFWDMLRFVNDEDTTQYRALAVRAVATNSRNLYFVPETYVDRQFLSDVLALGGNYAIDSFYSLHPQVAKEFFGPHGLEELMESDLNIRNRLLSDFLIGHLENADITESFVQESLVLCPGLVASLKRSGREHLVVEVIRQGGWPEQYASDKPTDLKDAIKKMKKAISSVAAGWQRAYIKTLGTAEVVRAMKSARTLEMLENIYTREEILPHLTNRRDLKTKGKWIEDALGL
jgi:hypothetical protein